MGRYRIYKRNVNMSNLKKFLVFQLLITSTSLFSCLFISSDLEDVIYHHVVLTIGFLLGVTYPSKKKEEEKITPIKHEVSASDCNDMKKAFNDSLEKEDKEDLFTISQEEIDKEIKETALEIRDLHMIASPNAYHLPSLHEELEQLRHKLSCLKAKKQAEKELHEFNNLIFNKNGVSECGNYARYATSTGGGGRIFRIRKEDMKDKELKEQVRAKESDIEVLRALLNVAVSSRVTKLTLEYYEKLNESIRREEIELKSLKEKLENINEESLNREAIEKKATDVMTKIIKRQLRSEDDNFTKAEKENELKHEYNKLVDEAEKYVWVNNEPSTINNDFKTITNSIASLLEYKNTKYGDAVLRPLEIFTGKCKAGTRLDDKLSRVKNGEELKKNDVSDLIGYLVLTCKEKGWNNFDEFKD